MEIMAMVHLYIMSLGLLALMALGGWLISLQVNKVCIVDSLWSFFIAVAGLSFVYATGTWSQPFVLAACVFLVLWAVRLSGHITFRNWGKEEDHRYVAIGKNHQPFKYKSLYFVFGLQALLASFVALPFLGMVVAQQTPVFWLYCLAATVTLFGIVFEAVADWQLYHFIKNKKSGQVMDKGLWRYTRHPNYFGEFCVWWGFFGMAMSMGAWWTVVSPLLMTFLLLKVSGVGMMEKTITETRPNYRAYMAKTNAFFPGPPKKNHNNG
mgnify:CR=1 FL=1